MTLIDLFQARPATLPSGRRIEPLGDWPELSPRVEARLRKLERWERYNRTHRERKAAAQRAYRTRKAA